MDVRYNTTRQHITNHDAGSRKERGDTNAPLFPMTYPADKHVREQALTAALQHVEQERDAAEHAMRLSENRYRRLFEMSKDSIIIVDAATLAILDANPAAEQLLGAARTELHNRELPNLPPFTHMPDIRAALSVLTTQDSSRQELAIPATSMTPQRHLDVAASLYDDDTERIIQLNVRDISDRKKSDRLEAQTAGLIAERQELIDVNSAKDEFISVASHQLRTPATAVKQYIGLLLQGYIGDLPDDQRSMLERANASNERQLKIINDLLLVARVDAGKIDLIKERTNLPNLIRDIATEQQAVLEQRKQALTLELPSGLKAMIDVRFMRMVIENLLSNASKYSPEGRPISIIAWRSRIYVYIQVKDEGYGISQADQCKLYRKFSRIYNKRAAAVEGTGLGLYWCKKIIELHNGTLELESELDHGAAFTMRLPIK